MKDMRTTYFLLFFSFFIVLAMFSLYRTWNRREFGYYWVQIPALLFSLVMNLLIAAEVHLPSLSSLLMRVLSKFVK